MSWRARTLPVIVLAVLTVLATGCSRSVPGTAHAEGEGPVGNAPATSPTAEVAPPTAFQEPSGRPTVTVAPDGVPLLPGTPTPTSEPVVPRPLPGSGDPTGEPTSAPPQAAGPTGDGAGTDRTPAPGRAGGPSPDRARAAPGPDPSVAPPLTSDVVANECLLDPAQFAALLGGPVGAPADNEVIRPDGSRTRSCYATARAGSTIGAVNVYRVNRGTPAAFVRAAAGGRQLSGVGEAAVLLDTVGGSALQVATPRFLVTIGVVDGAPTEDRWRRAGLAAAAAVARR